MTAAWEAPPPLRKLEAVLLALRAAHMAQALVRLHWQGRAEHQLSTAIESTPATRPAWWALLRGMSAEIEELPSTGLETAWIGRAAAMGP